MKICRRNKRETTPGHYWNFYWNQNEIHSKSAIQDDTSKADFP